MVMVILILILILMVMMDMVVDMMWVQQCVVCFVFSEVHIYAFVSIFADSICGQILSTKLSSTFIKRSAKPTRVSMLGTN
jgi:hypothetical protein